MRLAFFGRQSAFDYFHIGGTESLTRRLARSLTTACDVAAVDYVMFHAPSSRDEVVMPGVRVRHFRTYDGAERALPEYDHIVSLHLSPKERLRYAAFRARMGDRLRFHAFRTGWPSPRWKEPLMLLDLQLAPPNGCVFALSPRIYRRIKRWARRPFVMLPVVPDDMYVQPANKSDGAVLRVSYAGRVDPGKGAGDVAALFLRLAGRPGLRCRFYSYTFEKPSDEEREILESLASLPAGVFVEVKYTHYTPETDRLLQGALADTDVLLLPYRDITSTADTPFLLTEGMASLCAVVLPRSADLPKVYGQSPFYLDPGDPVDSMTDIISRAPGWLKAERTRLAERNRELNYGANASAKALHAAMTGSLQPTELEWPRSLMTYGGRP